MFEGERVEQCCDFFTLKKSSWSSDLREGILSPVNYFIEFSTEKRKGKKKNQIIPLKTKL